MEHLSFDWKSKKLTLTKSEIPTPGEDEVLVRVAYSGICGTDIHILNV